MAPIMHIEALYSTESTGVGVGSAVEVRVVLAYESLSAALRAADAIAILHCQAREGVAVRLSPWSFAALENPQWRLLAALEVARAEMIMLASCNATQRLSAGIERWLKASLARRHPTPFAVAALFNHGGSPDHPETPRMQSVRRLAQEAGCEFIASQPNGEW